MRRFDVRDASRSALAAPLLAIVFALRRHRRCVLVGSRRPGLVDASALLVDYGQQPAQHRR